MNQLKFKLTPGYITGLTQTDGCFSCGFIVTPNKTLTFRLVFSITADLPCKYVLDEICKYFGCGNVNINKPNNTANFVVTKTDDLLNIIIPHFNENPLFCAKLHAFDLFKLIINEKIKNKNNKDKGWKKEIVQMGLSMNKLTLRKAERMDEIYEILGISNRAELPLIENTKNTIDTKITDDNLAGIIDGDGSFWVSFEKTGKMIPGFSITLDTATKPVLDKIKEQFNNVGLVLEKKKTYWTFIIQSLKALREQIIPFMDLNPIFSERAGHYAIFRKVCFMIQNEKPLTLQTKLEIVELAYNANKSGKRRKIPKAEYIELLKKIHSEKQTVSKRKRKRKTVS